jgi:hypothetical protein
MAVSEAAPLERLKGAMKIVNLENRGGERRMAAENPVVQYLNSLRTQQQGSNPSYVEENRRVYLDRLRAGHPWFPSDTHLHVTTRLDTLVDQIAAGDALVGVIILTGDAGDGKTAVCARVAERLGHQGDLQPVTVVAGLTIVKDASELVEQELRLIFREFLTARPGRLLVAINEGRLRKVMLAARAESDAELGALWERVVEPALASWIDREHAEQLDDAMREAGVAVVNFRHRMHVRTVVPALLRAWTPAPFWEGSPPCAACPARARCPIIANASDLRDSHTVDRVEDVLASAHYAGQRLPFRRLQGVLAMTVTGGLTCKEVQTGPLAAPTASTLDVLRYRYYEALFSREPARPVPIRPEPVSAVLAAADAGAHSDQHLDAQVATLVARPPDEAVPWLDQRPLPDIEAQAIRRIRESMAPGDSNRLSSSAPDELARLTRSLRRWAMLTSPKPSGAPWRKALELMEQASLHDNRLPLQRAVIGALNRLHRHVETREDSLSAHQFDPSGFRNPARLALELDLGTDFVPDLHGGPVLPGLVASWLEGCAGELELSAQPPGLQRGDPARLRLDLRLIEILLGVREGYDMLPALGAWRRELARFHGRLVSLATAEGHAPAITLRAGGSSYRVSVVGPDGAGRLRFDGNS